jgi:hypothetical protein
MNKSFTNKEDNNSNKDFILKEVLNKIKLYNAKDNLYLS